MLEFGHDVSFAPARSQIGKGGDKLIPVFLPADQQHDHGKELEEWRGKRFKENYLSLVRPFSAVPNLLRRGRDAGLRIAIASSAKKDELDKYLDIAGIRARGSQESRDRWRTDDFLYERTYSYQTEGRTAVLFDGYVRNHVEPALGTRRAPALTRRDVEALHRAVGRTHPVTANRVIAFIGAVYAFGLRTGLLPQGSVNPAGSALRPYRLCSTAR